MSKQNEISKFYSKREINLIAEYLGRKTTLHPDLLEPNALNPVDENWDESTKGIAIQEGASYASLSPDEYALDNAIARICLSIVQDQLPQFAAFKDNEVKLGRNIKDLHELPERVLLPVHLFTINWANTAPGLSWPETYYVTQLPEWGVHIVTASQDSDEIYGYEDFAIGWVDDKTSSLHGARKVLINYWKNLRDEFGQERWEELLDISFGDPESWTDEVWPEQRLNNESEGDEKGDLREEATVTN